MKNLFLSLILVSLLLFSACSPAAPPQSTEDPEIHIRGTVKNLIQGKDGVTFLVEGSLDKDTQYDKASVTATKNTIVTIRGINTLVALDFTEVKEGQLVEITFTGAVAESYPVQAQASSITIIPK
jgi:hypothetical protein